MDSERTPARSMYKIVQGITFVGQLGFMIVTPPLVMVYLAYQAQVHFGWGAWVMVLAILIGILSAISSTFTTFYKMLNKKNSAPEEKDKRNTQM